mgnify:CR=1 FL=1
MDAIAAGAFWCPDPWAGEPATARAVFANPSRGSLPFEMLPLFYAFRSRAGKEFWVCIFSTYGRPTHVFLPEQDCLIYDYSQHLAPPVLESLLSTIEVARPILEHDCNHLPCAAEAIGLLDPFQVRGIVAGFWYQTKYDFLTLMARGAKGVADAWRTSIVTALQDKASKESPLEHKLVKFLMGDFVEAINELEARKAELDSQIKAADPKSAKDADGEEGEDTDEENAVDEAQLKAWKKELATVKKQLKAKKDSFAAHLNTAVDGLSPEQAADLLLTILHNDMRAIVERYIAAQRKAIVAAFENWWDKYRVTLTEIEGKRDAAAKALQGFLKGLGYV